MQWGTLINLLISLILDFSMDEAPNIPQIFLDCTLRDGGYYNDWNFSSDLVNKYLLAVKDCGVNAVEIGFRSLLGEGFKGAYAYSKEAFLNTINMPDAVVLGVMVNGSELIVDELVSVGNLNKLFPVCAKESKIKLVRIACHHQEFESCLPASKWLKERGYLVGFNIMQIAERSAEEIQFMASQASNWPIDVLYFADSMGSLCEDMLIDIIYSLQQGWKKALGFHGHDNIGRALQNTLIAINNGVTWVDATVTGMGRGAGNTRTSDLAIEIAIMKGLEFNIVGLLSLIKKYFSPLRDKYRWGTNTYYYLAGKYGIHPTYIQKMLNDARFNEEDILTVIERLRTSDDRKKYNAKVLGLVRQFCSDKKTGTWKASTILEGRDILILATGPSVKNHSDAIESFIKEKRPYVLALNTQSAIRSDLIDVRVACHPLRLLTDCFSHKTYAQPLITPLQLLPESVLEVLKDKVIYDFGLSIDADKFVFYDSGCALPNALVLAYSLAVATSGKANKAYLAGLDGYGAGDPRTEEVISILNRYMDSESALELFSITETQYPIKMRSVYALC